MQAGGYGAPFAAGEYAARIALTRRRMAERGLDLLICQDPANMCWLTGFDSWSFYTPQAVVLHGDEDWPWWFGRAQDARSAAITTILPSDRIVAYSEPLVNRPEQHSFDELSALIRDRGWGHATVGVELDAPYYTARAHRHLVDGLPGARIVDSRELVNRARAVKPEAELALMRAAGRICSSAMRRAIETVRPGVRQAEVVAEIYRAQTLGVDGQCGDYTAICPLMQVGEGTSTPHLTWTDARLPDAGLVVLEIAAARRHYHAPLTRTLHLGPPPPQVRDLALAVVEGGDTALDRARPGATCAEVEAAWQAVLRRHGHRKDSRVGYSIGLAFPPDWGERTMSLRPGDETVLEPGMCFHFQSGVWTDTFGAAISEPFIVTDRGGERLCDVPRELIVID